MPHKLLNVKYNASERKMYRWSGHCLCQAWTGMAPSEDRLRKFFKKHESGMK